MPGIVARHSLASLPHRESLLWWQKQGLSFTASGYGSRVPTRHMVQIPGSPRWRRVYCCIYSNSGTCYVDTQEGWIVITD